MEIVHEGTQTRINKANVSSYSISLIRKYVLLINTAAQMEKQTDGCLEKTYLTACPLMYLLFQCCNFILILPSRGRLRKWWSSLRPVRAKPEVFHSVRALNVNSISAAIILAYFPELSAIALHASGPRGPHRKRPLIPPPGDPCKLLIQQLLAINMRNDILEAKRPVWFLIHI